MKIYGFCPLHNGMGWGSNRLDSFYPVGTCDKCKAEIDKDMQEFYNEKESMEVSMQDR